MARTVEQINQQIIDNVVSGLSVVGITLDTTQWSKRNILRVIIFSVATGIGLLEQLKDIWLGEFEDVAASAAAASQLWIQKKMFEFQYSATVPQVLELVDVVPQYPIVDETLRIITACVAKRTVSGAVQIKVAKSNPFVALSGGQLSAAQSYIDILGAAGINYVVTTGEADKLYIEADIWHKGEYTPVITATVIAALNAFLQNLSVTNFDGGIKMSDIELTIRAVPGVNDVLLKNVRCRADVVVFANGTDLILNNTVIARTYNLVSGYAVQETDSGKTFTDTLNFIAE